MTEVKVNVKALLETERKKYQTIIDDLNAQVKELQGMVMYERERREYAEGKLAEQEAPKPKRKRRTKAEMEAARAEQREYCEFKSNGVRKKTRVCSIRSYTDFKKIQDYFLAKNKVRDYALWTIGVCLGVRISDLTQLKWKDLTDEKGAFKERIKIYEKKTSKLQNCLITEGIRSAATKLLNSMSWQYDQDGYVFRSSRSDRAMSPEKCYKIIHDAADAVGIDYPIGTHTMRESFANIVLCVDKNTIDMNAITKIQGLLNHSDARVTMKYLGKLDEMYDKARKTVSDFVLGKTGVDELVCGDTMDTEQIMDKLNELERYIRPGNETGE